MALPGAEIGEAAGIRKRKGFAASAQCRIHSVGLEHRRANQRRVPVDMVHGGKKREMTFVLDDPEGEAAPLQRIRYGHDVSAYFVDCHVAVIDRREFNVGGVGEGMPHELAVIGGFEPTAERVMSA